MKPIRLYGMKITSLVMSILVLSVCHGVYAAGATTSPTTASTTTNTATTPPDSSYTYNATTGLWENGTYSWDPTTGQTKPLTQTNYSYNPSTGMWDTTDWRYNTSTQTYDPNTPTPTQTTQNGPTASTSPSTPTTTQPTQTTPTTSAITSGQTTPGQNSVTTPTTTTPTDNHFFDLFYNAKISNTVESSAHTGDATVSNNTVGGSATSGNAQAITNLINLLQSYWGAQSSGFTTFTKDINGNVVGDIYIDPRALTQASSTNPSTDPLTTTQVNSATNGLIDNNVNVGATSGNATVSNNTSAGDATSGNATAVVNLLNLINSAIASNQSFLGVINIYGDLNGDILLPPDVLNTLLANNSGTSQGASSLTSYGSQQINNAITTTAQTGTATVSNNTSAGDATSGNALTNITLLNLTGHQIIGKDTLLVFVNVLGHWVGLLMDAPTGSTAAALGGGITQNATSPINTGDVALTDANAINNTVTVAAQSGDATVNNNTTAGNATTGNATASANILNIINSNLSLSDWFGVLFINVFGNWIGSFGINTIAGTVHNLANSSPSADLSAQAQVVFQFIPKQYSLRSMQRYVGHYLTYLSEPIEGNDSNNTVTGDSNDQQNKGFAAYTSPSNGGGSPLLRNGNQILNNTNKDWFIAVVGFTIGALILAGEQGYSQITRRRLTRMRTPAPTSM